MSTHHHGIPNPTTMYRDAARVLEKKLDGGEGKMGGRVTGCPLGLPNNSKAAQGGDTIRPGLWHGYPLSLG